MTKGDQHKLGEGAIGAHAARKEEPATNSRLGEGELPALICFTNVLGWERRDSAGEGVEIFSPVIRTRAAWDQAVISWNIEPADGAGLKMEARVPAGSDVSPWYTLGSWSLHGHVPLARTSINGQSDDIAEVRTDILAVRSGSREVELRLTLVGTLADEPGRLRLVALSLWNSREQTSPREPLRKIWGRSLGVPQLSQVSYPGGEAWCSPTALGMVLGWWSDSLQRADLKREVPEIARCVHDPAWPGTGNWPFNTAYAATFPGITACAARLRDLRAVEELIAEDIPVVLSVNPPVLRGEPPSASGHLIVCVGFTEDGDCVVHDPWARLEQGDAVRRVYLRDRVERAWSRSGNLAYLIAPSARACAFPADFR